MLAPNTAVYERDIGNGTLPVMPEAHDPYVPAEELVKGLELMKLPAGYTPLSMMVCIKTIDEEGDIAWLYRYSKDLNAMEGLGAAHIAVALQTHDIKAAYKREEDD